jgi:hypothetical protein
MVLSIVSCIVSQPLAGWVDGAEKRSRENKKPDTRNCQHQRLARRATWEDGAVYIPGEIYPKNSIGPQKNRSAHKKTG